MNQRSAIFTVGIELECVRLRDEPPEAVLDALRETGAILQADRLVFTDSCHFIHPDGGPEIATKPYRVHVGASSGNCISLEGYEQFKADLGRLFSLVSHLNRFCDLHLHIGFPSDADNAESIWSLDALAKFLTYGAQIEDRLYQHVPPSRRDWPSCQTIRAVYGSGTTVPLTFHPADIVAAGKRRLGLGPSRYLDRRRWCWMNVLEACRRQNGVAAAPNEYPLNEENRSTGTIEIRMLGDKVSFEEVWGWTEYWLRFSAAVLLLSPQKAKAFCTRDPFSVDELKPLRRFSAEGYPGPSHRIFSPSNFSGGQNRRIVEQGDRPAVVCSYEPDPSDPPRRILPQRDSDGRWGPPLICRDQPSSLQTTKLPNGIILVRQHGIGPGRKNRC